MSPVLAFSIRPHSPQSTPAYLSLLHLNLTVLIPRARHAPACFSLLPGTSSFTLGPLGEPLSVLNSTQTLFYEMLSCLHSFANILTVELTTRSCNSLHMCFSPTFGHEFLLGRDCVLFISESPIPVQCSPQRSCWVNRSFLSEWMSTQTGEWTG